MLRRLALAALAAFSLSDAHAGDTKLTQALTGFRKVSTNVYERIPSNTGTAAGSSRSWAVVAGKAEATDAVVISNGPVGNLPVTAKGTIDKVGMATTIASMFLPGWASIALQAAKAVYDQVRVSADASGNLTADPGQATVQTTVYQINPTGGVSTVTTGSSPDAVCTAYIDKKIATLSQSSGNNTFSYAQQTYPGYPTATTCLKYINVHQVNCPSGGGQCTVSDTQTSGGGPIVQTTGPTCPASIDPLNPANSIPAGGAIGADGKCPTARYNHVAATVDDAVAKASQYLTADQMIDALKKAIEAGGTADILPTAITGPVSQDGTPVVSSTTDSTGTTTTTTTPKYNYDYSSPTQVKVTPGETVQTVKPGGATTTTTTTGGQPNNTTVQVPDFCLDYPDRAGCKLVGEPPSPENIQTESNNVHVSPEGGFGADSGTCPGLVHTVSLGNVDVFGMFCKFMAGIRFAVVGCAWIIAAMIFIGRTE